MVHIILAMQSMIILSIIFTFLAQICGSKYFERSKQTLNEISFCTTDYAKYKDQLIRNKHIDNDSMKQGKKLNHTITILFWNKNGNDGIMDGQGFQPFQTCLHKNCLSTRDKSLLHNPKHIIDAIVFYGGKDQFIDDLNEMKQFKESKELVQQMNQGIKPKMVLFIVESPLGAFGKDTLSEPIYQGIFDLTMTYRHDSDVVLNYGNLVNRTSQEKIMPNSFIKYDEHQIIDNLTEYGLIKLEERANDIAWIVSHCYTISKREDYVKKMEKYKGLKIDIFGGCGKRTSEIGGRSAGWISTYGKLASKYKFYLSFENSRCYEYITEKFFTALKVGMIPVVLGGLSKHDYEKIAPQHSFIHVDDFSSPRDLMKKLHKISNDPIVYNSYFWWRKHYRVAVNISCCPHKEWAFPACQLCEVLNSDNIQKNKYANFTAFWNKCI